MRLQVNRLLRRFRKKKRKKVTLKTGFSWASISVEDEYKNKHNNQLLKQKSPLQMLRMRAQPALVLVSYRCFHISSLTFGIWNHNLSSDWAEINIFSAREWMQQKNWNKQIHIFKIISKLIMTTRVTVSLPIRTTYENLCIHHLRDSGDK